MNRKGFLKSLATIIAAPALLESFDTKCSTVTKKRRNYTKSMRFKISQEMKDDTKHMEFLLYNKHSWISILALSYGIDMTKDFDCKIGFDGDDFIYNKLTCIIRQ